MEAAKFWSVASLAFVLVLCITSTSVTWHCLNEVARLQSRVERLEAEDKGISVSQLLGQLGVQTPVYQGDGAEEDIPGHQREVRQTALHDYIQQIVQSQLEVYLGVTTTETDSQRSKRSTLTPRQWNPLKGQKGEPGPPGPPGTRGRSGRKGSKGEQGVPGERGEKGDMGTIGEKGERGATGLTGPAGEKGDKGNNGQKGDTGSHGLVGGKGEKGERGDTGLTGPEGAKGQPGDPGSKGSSGEKGQKGERGEKGDEGSQGLPCEQGPKGEKGAGDLCLAPVGYGPCGCGGPGWTRIAYLNMTDTTHHCPSDWRLITSPKRSCGRVNDDQCDSAIFSSRGIQYSQVCGRIIGYQKDTTEAFFQYNSNPSLTLDGPYVDGISVTRGSPREHIWTFAAGIDETGHGSDADYHCPCITAIDVSGITVPPFIGGDYFCESGTTETDWPSTGHVYTDDPLWDGQGCGPTTNCCTFNNPPWFCKELPQATADDIEARICSAQEINNEDTYVELIEIYVQ